MDKCKECERRKYNGKQMAKGLYYYLLGIILVVFGASCIYYLGRYGGLDENAVFSIAMSGLVTIIFGIGCMFEAQKHPPKKRGER